MFARLLVITGLFHVLRLVPHLRSGVLAAPMEHGEAVLDAGERRFRREDDVEHDAAARAAQQRPEPEHLHHTTSSNCYV